MDGRIKIHRKIDEWGWRSKPNTFSLFIYLVMNASLKDCEFQGHKIKRGDCIIGRKSLSEKLGISERGIRTSLNHLKSTNEVTIKTTSKFSIVSVVKYSDYQYIENVEGPSKGPSKGPATDQQPTTLKEDNNIYNREQVKKLLDEEYIMMYATPLKCMMIMIDMGYYIQATEKDVKLFVDRIKEKAKIYKYYLPNGNYDWDGILQKFDRRKTYHQENNTKIDKHKTSVLQFLNPDRKTKGKRKK